MNTRTNLLAWASIVFMCAIFISGYAEIKNDEMRFEEILIQSKQAAHYRDDPSKTNEIVGQLVKDLDAFAKNYPKSKYADDATFIIIELTTPLALKNKDHRLLGNLEAAVQDLCARYPDAKIEPWTIQELTNNRGHENTFMYRIPLVSVPFFMRATMGLVDNDYPAARDNFLKLKDNIELSGYDKQYLRQLIYSSLAKAYLGCERPLDTITALEQEAFDKFPDDIALQKSIDQMKQQAIKEK